MKTEKKEETVEVPKETELGLLREIAGEILKVDSGHVRTLKGVMKLANKWKGSYLKSANNNSAA